MDLIIRRSVETDAPDLANVHVASWRAGYVGLMPEELLDNRSLDASETMFKKRMEGSDESGEQILIAEVNGTAVGFCGYGPGRDEGTNANTGEIMGLYVLRDHWGRGIGTALTEKSMEDLAAAGFDNAFLWVLETNLRTIRFYERGGWQRNDKTRTVTLRGYDLPHAQMIMRL
jgi:ribosomal protein S18 acetylase RimI-like enzyme